MWHEKAVTTSLPPGATSLKPLNLLHGAGPAIKNPYVVLQRRAKTEAILALSPLP